VVLMQWKSWHVGIDGVALCSRRPAKRSSHYWRNKEMTEAGVIDRLIKMGASRVKTPL
jgi:hypothetical protein